MASPFNEGDWVTLARLAKTQGHKGELAAEPLTDIEGRFEQVRRVFLAHPSGRRLETTLTRHWRHGERIVLAFADVPDMNAAEAWVGADVQVPAAERAAAPADAYFVDDLVGCELWDGERAVGRITAVEPVAAAAPLLHVAAADGAELLIPFVQAYLERISLPERRITMRLPEGLTGINRAERRLGARGPRAGASTSATRGGASVAAEHALGPAPKNDV